MDLDFLEDFFLLSMQVHTEKNKIGNFAASIISIFWTIDDSVIVSLNEKMIT